MKLTKIKISNLFGIKECEINGGNIEITGDNGTGKTSIIDAIKYALKNKSDRDYIIKNGTVKGEILIETDSGLSIKRKIETGKSDYKKVTQSGADIRNPETVLRDIITELQLDPVEFVNMTSKEQNRIILDMIDFKWDKNWIIEQFGELVPNVDYTQNILQVLYDIQKDDGYFFLKRQDINREIRNNQAFVEQIGSSLPKEYNAKYWKEYPMHEKYEELDKIRISNDKIMQSKKFLLDAKDRISAFKNKQKIALDECVNVYKDTIEQKERLILSLKKDIDMLNIKINEETEMFNNDVKEYEKEINIKILENHKIAENEIVDTEPLRNELIGAKENIEHLSEYERMVSLQDKEMDLKTQSDVLTDKIEKARNLPAYILENSHIPIDNITIKDGMALINGLPISNLSEGEKLNLCIDVAVQNKKNLNILLIDGIEKLSDQNRNILYNRLKDNNVQFVATRTTNDNELIVREI
jgi:energy-coupling factor transporter ATP-binding protein EcfA2